MLTLLMKIKQTNFILNLFLLFHLTIFHLEFRGQHSLIPLFKVNTIDFSLFSYLCLPPPIGGRHIVFGSVIVIVSVHVICVIRFERDNF